LDENGTLGEKRLARFVLPALVVSGFATYPAMFATMLLLIEIGEAIGPIHGLLMLIGALVFKFFVLDRGSPTKEP